MEPANVLLYKQQAVVEFLVREGLDGPTMIYDRLQVVYGSGCLSKEAVNELYLYYLKGPCRHHYFIPK